MIRENTTNIGFIDITEDKGVIKKVLRQGFGITPTNGLELTVNYTSQLEDGRILDNTFITKEPHVFCLGNHSVVPGLELALMNMRMGEEARVVIKPEYSFLAQKKLSKLKETETDQNNLNHLTFEKKLDMIIESVREEIMERNYSNEDLAKMEPKDAKNFANVIYEIELVKFDKHRKHKSVMEPDERIAEAAILKNEGNDLFKEKRYQEAIVKYNDGILYLYQLPNDSITTKVIDLKMNLKMNIINCHVCLNEHNYALKKLEEAFSIKNPPPSKCYYFRCIAYMNLGEFEKAGKDFKLLKSILPNDPLVNKLQEDFVKIKENTMTTQKKLIRKGIFGSNLYEEKTDNIKTNVLPEFDKTNTSFYIDFLLNNNNKDPQKIKIEIFSNTKLKFDLYTSIIEDIKNKKWIKNNIKLESIISKGIVLDLVDGVNNGKYDNLFTNSDTLTNNYPPCEEFLLIFLRSKEENEFVYKLFISIDKISNSILPDLIVLGRTYYNTNFLKRLCDVNEDETALNVIECDFAYNI